VLYGGPVTGRNTVTIATPHYEGGILTLEVYAGDGNIVGKRSIPIKISQPTVLFYEESPLRGLLGRAITKTSIGNNAETTFLAEPYFLHTQGLEEQFVDFTWKLSNATIMSDVLRQNAVTLTSSKIGAGDARVSLTAVTKTPIPQHVQNSFNISVQ
jgi:hypothetical protein